MYDGYEKLFNYEERGYVISLSPNHYDDDYVVRHSGHHLAEIQDKVYLHTTEGFFPEDLDYLRNPNVQNPVSCTVYIQRDGTRHLVVPFNYAAWHGWVRPEWRLPKYFAVCTPQAPGTDLNGNYHAYGIEMEATYRQPATEEQLRAAVETILDMQEFRPSIKLDRDHILGHYEVNSHKIDPPGFDWDPFMLHLVNQAAVRHGQPAPVVPVRKVLQVGIQAAVTGTGGQNLLMRSTPRHDGLVIGKLPENTVFSIIGASVNEGGHAWWRIQTVTGATGWAAGEFMRAV